MDDAARARQLELENERLRQRVADLERRLSGFDADRDTALGDSESERRALWVEAERVAHVGTWVWNFATNEVWWSEELFRILGYDPTTDSASSEAFFARIHPEDLQRVQDGAAQLAATGANRRDEHRLLLPDGTVRHVATNGAVLFDDDGNIARVVGVIRDFTEEHEATAAIQRQGRHLQDAAEVGKLGFYRFDVATGVVWFSDSLREMVGSHDGELSLEDVVARLDATSSERGMRALEQVMRGSDPEPFQGRASIADGTFRDFYVVTAIERDDARQPIATRGVIIDVTERVGLEARLRQAEKMEALGQLAAGVAHDFNNLLTVILSSGARIQSDTFDQEIQDVMEAARAAARLTGQMLSFSRQAVGAPRAVDARAGVEECLSLLRRTIPENIRVSYSPPSDAMQVRIDPGQLHQILMNIAVNARDAMPGGGELAIDCDAVDVEGERADANDVKPGRYIQIEIRDSGVGIDEETSKRIFDPFFTTKEAGKGTGLGLASALGAARQSGGVIVAESEPGKGTTFTILLPEESGRHEEPVDFAPVSGVRHRRILLVEDETAVRRVVARMLRDEGHDVTDCADAKSGIAAWRDAGGFDIVITDYMMPDMNGVELIEQLRQERADVPALILSGWGFKGEAVRTLGNTWALQKPFGREEILEALRTLLGVAA